MNAFNLFLGIMSLDRSGLFLLPFYFGESRIWYFFVIASWGVAISNKLAWILMECPCIFSYVLDVGAFGTPF